MSLIDIFGFAADSYLSSGTGAKISFKIDTRSLYWATQTLSNMKYLNLLKINFRNKNSTIPTLLYVAQG
jgi:hypothetical protein